jgi:intracellular multiplication protein IcmO
MRLNHFLQVERLKSRVINDFVTRYHKYLEIIKKPDIYGENAPIETDEIRILRKTLADNEFLDPIERGISALITYHNQSNPSTQTREAEDQKVIEELPPYELNIFCPIRTFATDRSEWLRTDPAFVEPILSFSQTKDAIRVLEHVSGRQEQLAQNISQEIIKDLRTATHYPPTLPTALATTAEALSEKVLETVKRFTDAQKS